MAVGFRGPYILRRLFPQNKALFIPRDKIPAFWWNSHAEEVELERSRETSAFIAKYIVNLDTTENCVADIQRILISRMKELKSLKALLPVPVAPLVDNEGLEEGLDEMDLMGNEMTISDHARTEQLTTAKNNSHWPLLYERGFGSFQHLQTRKSTC